MRSQRLFRAFSATSRSLSDLRQFLPAICNGNRIAACVSAVGSIAFVAAIAMFGAVLAAPATAASLLSEEPFYRRDPPARP